MNIVELKQVVGAGCVTKRSNVYVRTEKFILQFEELPTPGESHARLYLIGVYSFDQSKLVGELKNLGMTEEQAEDLIACPPTE